MKFSAQNLKFDWIVDAESPSLRIDPNGSQEKETSEWKRYPFPPSLGEGGFENVTLSLGMGAFRAKHSFHESARGQSLPLARIEVAFDEPTFEVLSARKGHFLHDESEVASLLSIGPSQDLFRYTEGYAVTPYLDTNDDSELIAIAIGKTPLEMIIGADSAKQLLERLEIDDPPKVRIQRIPKHIQKPLHECFNTPYQGSVRKLHIQAEILRYLAGLSDFLSQGLPRATGQKGISQKAVERANAVKDYLLVQEGKPPTMEELATHFGRSSRTLNDEFTHVFGQSIFTFLTRHRLELAYAAIRSTETPLKVISQQIGYAHVNHFSAAFRRIFGHPPGALRRNGNAEDA